MGPVIGILTCAWVTSPRSLASPTCHFVALSRLSWLVMHSQQLRRGPHYVALPRRNERRPFKESNSAIITNCVPAKRTPTHGPSNASQTHTMSNSADADLMGLGEHCAVPHCSLLDFLPFKCDCCTKTFCLSHRSVAPYASPPGGDVRRIQAGEEHTSQGGRAPLSIRMAEQSVPVVNSEPPTAPRPAPYLQGSRCATPPLHG